MRDGLRVLVIGSGGREHALAWSLAHSQSVGAVVCAPGNPGMARLGRCIPVDVTDAAAIASLADDLDAHLTVVGPEVPLVAGAIDAIEARGRRAFGPRAAGARLEGSKSWMKALLAEAGVPSAAHASFTSDRVDAAVAYLDTMSGFYVVKTDGLAAGKGVVVTESIAEARDTVRAYLSGAAFGDAGRTCVIEEGLSGPEVSLLVLCDGRDAVPLAPAQDFKRIGERDTGPNTGGMGAYSPVPFVDTDLVDRVMESAVRPTLAALARHDVLYRGILYAGIMLTPDGPKILEYNVRFGDPECQVVLPRLASDLALHCLEAASGAIRTELEFVDDACVSVVLASGGYPRAPRTGDVIDGIEAAEELPGVTVFQAGTTAGDRGIVTAGGRVLNVSAMGATLAKARARAYEAVERITWSGMQYRRDIAASGENAREGGIPPSSERRSVGAQ